MENKQIAILAVAAVALIAAVYVLAQPSPSGEGIDLGLLDEDSAMDIGGTEDAFTPTEVDSLLLEDDYSMELGELI